MFCKTGRFKTNLLSGLLVSTIAAGSSFASDKVDADQDVRAVTSAAVVSRSENFASQGKGQDADVQTSGPAAVEPGTAEVQNKYACKFTNSLFLVENRGRFSDNGRWLPRGDELNYHFYNSAIRSSAIGSQPKNRDRSSDSGKPSLKDMF